MIQSPLQIQYQSSVYTAIHHRHSTSPPYTDTALSITYTLLKTQFSPPYTPQSTAYQVLVFCIICSPLKNQYQSRVNCRVQCRPSTSLPYTLQSSTEPVPVLILLYSLLWTVPYLRTLCSHYRHSKIPMYTLMSL